jgi:hypothetical protein
VLREQAHLAGLGGPQLERDRTGADRPRPRAGRRTGPAPVSVEAEVGRSPRRAVSPLPRRLGVRPVHDPLAEPLEARPATHVEQLISVRRRQCPSPSGST